MVEAAIVRALAPDHLLFLCVANSARSQLAEGIARSLAPAGLRISSAGSSPSSVRPEAVQVLSEIGIDAKEQRSKAITDVDLDSVQAVVTLCDDEVCPFFPRPVPQLHWGMPDPAAEQGEREARLASFRSVRDQLSLRLGILIPSIRAAVFEGGS